MKTLLHKSIIIVLILFFGIATKAQTAPDLVKEGIALFDAGKYPEAIEEYNQALKLDPDNGNAIYELGYALFTTGKGKDAISHLEKLLVMNPKFGGAYDMLGSIYDDDHQPEKAIEYYKKGIEAAPTYQRLYYNLSIAYYRQKKFADAETNAITAIKLDPKHASSIRAYALATYSQQKRDCSLLAWCDFLMLEPQTKRSAEGYTYIHDILNHGISKKDDKHINLSVSSDELDAGILGMQMAVLSSTLEKKNLTVVDSLSLQLKSVFEITAELSAKNPSTFFNKFLAQYFGSMAKSGNVPALAHLVSLTAYKEENQTWFKDHPKELAELDKWVQMTTRSF